MWEKIVLNINNLSTLWGIGLAGGGVRILLDPKRRSFIQILSYLIVASVVCFGVGLYLIESDISMGVSFACMFCAGFFCHSLLNHVIKNEQSYIEGIEKRIKKKVVNDEE